MQLLAQNELQKLIEILVRRLPNLDLLDDLTIKQHIHQLLLERLKSKNLSLANRRLLIEQLYNTICGFDLLQPLLNDPQITEVMVNGPLAVYIEKEGKLSLTGLRFENKEHLIRVISRFFGRANKLINEANPIASMQLKDGSRLHAILPPAAPDGPCLSIRRFTGIKPSLNDLKARQSFTQEVENFLISAVQQKQNIFISGGTGTGKTTFLNALSAFIPNSERLITIEDSLELDLQDSDNLVRLESRPPSPDGNGEISLQDLIKASLRMRPDRIIVGEIRGAEAFDMVQAMSTGHPGSMSTGHGNSCLEMLDRICLLILMSANLPFEAIRRLVASSIDLIVHLERTSSGTRQVREIISLTGLANDQFVIEPIFQRNSENELLRTKN